MSAELFQQLRDDIRMSSAAFQVTAVFLSAFVLEDVATVGAGLLLAAGVLAWPTTLAACFLGIWIGDAGLYGFARWLGRPCFERTPLRRFSQRVAHSERWFAKRGNWILVFSRLLPGTRLPTYLAAGFLRLPLPRFLSVTGAAALVWTVFVLVFVQVLGTRALRWVGPLQQGGWVLLFGLAGLFLALRFAKRLATPGQLSRLSATLARWRHWEFWPTWLFYPPVALYCFRLAIKYRCLRLPTAANPGVFSGGLIGESKIATLRQLMDTSPEFTADAFLVRGDTPQTRLASIRDLCRYQGLGYPLILKPDIGQRGAGVKLIHRESEAVAYLAATQAPLLLQRYAPGPHEVGVFYYRFPQAAQGHVFAITRKIFPTVTGDGRSTIEDLIWADPRSRFLAAQYLQRLKGRENEILGPGQKVQLVQAGNHAQGCIFRDGRSLYTKELADRIDTISRKLDGFYIGRYDIRYSGEEDFRAGRNFQIVELNGASSEATSIYDPRNSLSSAYRTLFRQWDLVFAIGAANRSAGIPPTSWRALWRRWREYSRHAATYPPAD